MLEIERCLAFFWELHNMRVAALAGCLKFELFSSSTGDAKHHFLSEPRLSYAENQSAVLVEKADAPLIVTEWKEFRSPDFDSMKQKLNSPPVFDGRNG